MYVDLIEKYYYLLPSKNKEILEMVLADRKNDNHRKVFQVEFVIILGYFKSCK